MCIIQSYYFTKNVSNNFNCTANINDNIQSESVYSIDSTEVGKWCYSQFTVKNPDGSSTGYTSPQQIATSGIMTFTSSKIPLVIGTYTLVDSTLYVFSGGIWTLGCASTPTTPTICNTVAVSQPPCTQPSCSFNIV